ncbi:MAG TPA: hypothetical protein VNN74_02185 [Candidatus Micrarchaeia archaeon]|nr:hypothetical protein [Candidatus Micrarchaeia archaeon]
MADARGALVGSLGLAGFAAVRLWAIRAGAAAALLAGLGAWVVVSPTLLLARRRPWPTIWGGGR